MLCWPKEKRKKVKVFRWEYSAVNAQETSAARARVSDLTDESFKLTRSQQSWRNRRLDCGQLWTSKEKKKINQRDNKLRRSEEKRRWHAGRKNCPPGETILSSYPRVVPSPWLTAVLRSWCSEREKRRKKTNWNPWIILIWRPAREGKK